MDNREFYPYIPPQDRNPTCIITNRNNSNIVYVGIEEYKVYKSTNGGERWEQKSNGITNPYPRCFAMDPEDPNIIYLGCASGSGVSIFKTLDGGENWILSNLSNVEVLDIKVNPVNNNEVYAVVEYDTVVGTSLYKSTDGGINWFPIRTDDDKIRGIALTQSGVIYAGGYRVEPGGNYPSIIIKRSFDGGNNWQIVYYEFEAGWVSDIEYSYIPGITGLPYLIAVTSDKGVLKSIDGTNWFYENEGIEYRKKHLQKICFDPRNIANVFIGSKAIFFSQDAGNTWNDFPLTGIMENKDLGRFKSASFSIYTAYYQTLWRKEEVISKWSVKYIDYGYGVGDVDIARDNFSIIFLSFMGEDGSFTKSINKGISWSTPYYFDMGIKFIGNYNQNILYIGGYDAMTAHPAPAIYRSTNAGENWTGGYILPEGTGLNDLAIATPNIAYAGSNKRNETSYFFRTFDGENWEWLSDLGYLGHIYSLETYGEMNPAIVFAGTPSHIWRSNDCGNSWKQCFSLTGYGINDIISDPEDHAILYAVASQIIEPEKFPQILGNSRIFYSVDLGRKWFEIYPYLRIPVKQIEVDLNYTDTLLINTKRGGIYFTKTKWEKDQLTSSSNSALFGNSNIKLRKKQDTIFVIYESGNGIFYTYTNNYKDFKPKYEIDDGILPALDLNPDDPYVVYIKDNKIYGTARIIEQNGKRGWATPWLLYSPSLNSTINYPSFFINPSNFQGYVLFKETQENNITLKLIYFDARIPNPPVNLLPPIAGEIYDYCISKYNHQGVQVPSIVYTRNTPSGIKLFFRYWDHISNSWSQEEQIPLISVLTPSHPFLTFLPDNIPACAWSQNGIIYYSERRNETWGTPVRLSSSNYISDYPQIYPKPLIVCWRQIALTNSGGYQIVYRWKMGNEWTDVKIIDEGNENRDYPQIVCGKIGFLDYLFCIFQKKIEPIYELPFRKKPLIPTYIQPYLIDGNFQLLDIPPNNSQRISLFDNSLHILYSKNDSVFDAILRE